MLRETARAMFTRRITSQSLSTPGRNGYDDQLWSEMARLGWTGLPFPETLGGAGGDPVLLATLVEELGRAAAPSPFRQTVAGGALIAHLLGNGSRAADLVRGVATGDARTVLVGASGPYVMARLHGARHGKTLLDCAAAPIEWSAQADLLVCVAADDRGGIAILVLDPQLPGVSVVPTECFDNEQVAIVTLDGVRVNEDCALAPDPVGYDRVADSLWLVSAMRMAEALGGAQAAFESTVAFVKERHQFGQPIGSFQAVKHMCADVATELCGARLLLYEAVWLAGVEHPNGRSTAAAVLFGARAAEHAVVVASQLHGGIGFMKELPLHHHYQRVKAHCARLGPLRERLNTAAGRLLQPGDPLAPYPGVDRTGGELIAGSRVA